MASGSWKTDLVEGLFGPRSFHSHQRNKRGASTKFLGGRNLRRLLYSTPFTPLYGLFQTNRRPIQEPCSVRLERVPNARRGSEAGPEENALKHGMRSKKLIQSD